MTRSMFRGSWFAIAFVVAWVGVARAQPKPAPSQGTDFAVQARTLYRVAACAGDEPIPQRLSVKIVERHCKGMRDLYATHHARWADKAQKFISELRPKDAPKVVVYPFGGGDLSTALVAFPDATEITTISLEAAGDVRAIDTVKPGTLAVDLGVVTEDIRRLYFAAYSATKSLQAASRSPTFPGTLMFAFAGLALHDMEPVSLRYFDIEKDGSLRYLGAEELDQRAAELAKKGPAKPKTVKHYWYEHDSAFGNVEIQFRPRGDAKAPLRTYRHIVQNLDDTHLKADDRLLVHLRAKGTISAMTKAASFLLWYDDFTQIRDYLVGNIAWMISDSTGIPPAYADKAGLEQITYGDFAGPLFQIDPKNVRAQFVKLWKSQPRRPLGFRFGYRDLEKHPHLMITRRKP